jgi:hypothetical protein
MATIVPFETPSLGDRSYLVHDGDGDVAEVRHHREPPGNKWQPVAMPP